MPGDAFGDAKRYHVMLQGDQYGPYELDRIQTFIDEGKLYPDSQLITEDGKQIAASNVLGLIFRRRRGDPSRPDIAEPVGWGESLSQPNLAPPPADASQRLSPSGGTDPGFFVGGQPDTAATAAPGQAPPGSGAPGMPGEPLLAASRPGAHHPPESQPASLGGAPRIAPGSISGPHPVQSTPTSPSRPSPAVGIVQPAAGAEPRTSLLGGPSTSRIVVFALLGLIVILLILQVIFSLAVSAPVKQAHQQWEYKVLRIANEGLKREGQDSVRTTTIQIKEDQLEELGDAGWELVGSYLELESAFPNFGEKPSVNGIRTNVRPQSLVLLFKRPK